MIDNPDKRKVLIYCRVSSARQSVEGHGLESQEQRCLDYCQRNNLQVEKVFKDSWTGGGDFLERPSMKSLIEYLDNKSHQKYFVLFDDLKRFARDTIFHFKLRTLLKAKDVTPLCLNYNFDDTPEGIFVETIFAAQGQLEKDQNKRQVIQKQKARLEDGYWSFNSNIDGYKRKDLDGNRWILAKKEPKASIIKEAIEGFESGRFQSQSDVQEFLQSKNFCGRNRKVHLEKVKRLLTRSLYAGFIEYPEWEVSRRPGHHEAIVSEEVFDNVQRILREGRRVRTRKDIHEDFPLRGLIKSEKSEKPYTAAYASGRNGKYPYYRDTDKNSPYFNKSFKKDIVEKQMEKLFSDIIPEEEIIDFTISLIHDEWEQRKKNKGIEGHEIEKELTLLAKEKEKLTDRILGTENEAAIRAYESKIESIEIQQSLLNQKLGNSRSMIDFGTAFEKVMEYAICPLKQWKNSDLQGKRRVVQLAFDGPATYCPIQGFGTANLSPIYKVFEEISVSKSQGVEMAGIEPTCTQGK